MRACPAFSAAPVPLATPQVTQPLTPLATLKVIQPPKTSGPYKTSISRIKCGEAVGIIGSNGAGKSTLLKILSRITEPTTGRFEIFGRVSSLLEVGTGFHPELTGRENVYLNGTILGMKRREVKAKFDEIVAFSGVEKFIDTPVKHYSSGMQVRLAFAVAAHLEPEILIIDEVLAVGDAEFQKKCLGKMEDVTGEGRTVLFVSHNMGAVRRLCSKGVLIDQGKTNYIGNTSDALEKYILNTSIQTKDIIRLIDDSSQDFNFIDIQLSQNGSQVEVVQSVLPLTIKICYRIHNEIRNLRVFFDVLDSEYNLLFRSLLDEGYLGGITQKPGDYKYHAVIPAEIFVPVKYTIKVQAGIIGVKKFEPVNGYTISFLVEESGYFLRKQFPNEFKGIITQNVNWIPEKADAEVVFKD